MVARKFSNIAVATTLSSGITDVASSLTVVSATGWPAAPFIMVIEPDLANEELILVGAKAGAVFSTLTRGFGGTSGVAHNATDVIKHVAVAEDHTLIFTHVHVPGTDDSAQLSHDDLGGVSVDDHHNEAHTIVSHSDTGATGAELDTLTDGSVADVLHDHLHSATSGQGVDDHHDEDHAARHLQAGADSLTVGLVGDIAAIAVANAAGTVDKFTRPDHAHEVTDARLVVVDGDATVDNGGVDLSTSFQSGAALSFVMPTGWNTALIVARGSAVFQEDGGGGGGGDPVEVRIAIGASNGTAANNASANEAPTVGAAHQVVVSGNVTIDLEVRQPGAGPPAMDSATHELSYIAIRAS